MHILTTSAGQSGTIKVVLRSSIALSARISLYDKSSGSELVANPDATNITESKGITTIQFSFEQDLVEGRFYSLTIENFAQTYTYYKGLVFCTDQTIDQDTNNYYSVNDGEYVSETSYDNDYIIL